MLIIFPKQAIQDITRNRDIVPEEVVTLIYEKIDVNGEGKQKFQLFMKSMLSVHFLHV